MDLNSKRATVRARYRIFTDSLPPKSALQPSGVGDFFKRDGFQEGEKKN